MQKTKPVSDPPKPTKNGSRAGLGRLSRLRMAKTQAVTATKCEANSIGSRRTFPSPRRIGMSAIVMGMRRTDASATAIAAGTMPSPVVMAPVSTTMLGSAHTRPVMASVWPSVSPLSRASEA